MYSVAAAVILNCPFLRDIPFRDIAGESARIAASRVAVAAAARAAQNEALAGPHLVSARTRRFPLVLRADVDHETTAASVFSAGDALRRKAGPVEATDHGCIL